MRTEFDRIKEFIRRRWVKRVMLVGVVVILLFNTFVGFIYFTENKNELVFNSTVQKFLPLYRSLREVKKSIANIPYIPRMNANVDIPHYGLRIEPKDLRKLNENLPSSVSNEIFVGFTWLQEEYTKTVPAIFVADGTEYKVKVRYRGLNPNHWTLPKRSWHVVFDKDNPFNGVRVIKLILPSDRDYFAEYLNNYRADKLGLFYPETQFVGLSVNGSNHGVYYQFDSWSNKFLEKNGVPADANLYATDDLYMLNTFHVLGNRNYSAFADVSFWKKETNDRIFSFDNYGELDFLLSAIRRDDFPTIAPSIIDLEGFYSWMNVLTLAGSVHQDDASNIRPYFNQSTGKFEFIPWDVEVGPWGPDIVFGSNSIATSLFRDPARVLERNTRLWEYIKNETNLEDDLKVYDDVYEKLRPAFYADWKKPDSNGAFSGKVQSTRNHFSDRFSALQELFKKDESRLVTRYDENGVISIEVAMDNFAGLVLNEVTIPEVLGGATLYYDDNKDGIRGVGDTFIAASFSDQSSTVKFENVKQFLHNTPESEAEGSFITHTFFIVPTITKDKFNISNVAPVFTNAVTDEVVSIENARFADSSTFEYFDSIQQSPFSFVQNNPSFILQGGSIVLPAGTHIFRNTVVVPENTKLIIRGGSTLLFGEKASLISYSPIEAVNSTFQGIGGRSWGVVGVVNANSKSTFTNAVFKDGGEAYVNGIPFTGMLSAFHSDIEVTRSTFSGAQGDDGVNVKYGETFLTGNRFIANSADGLDLDFSTGEVKGNSFIDNGNDGIDISSSPVLVRDNYITRSGDKCISIGERTLGANIFNNVLYNCSIGIEVKDASTPRIVNNVIIGNDIGINAYRKKDIFIEGGLPEVYNSIISGNDTEISTDPFSNVTVHDSFVADGDKTEPVFVNPSGGNFMTVEVDSGGDAGIVEEIIGVPVQTAPIGLYKPL
tara:strand:+ start:23107 stop:25929 length:2823 start_codon:yes stop_codon:yes gene_type:complete